MQQSASLQFKPPGRRRALVFPPSAASGQLGLLRVRDKFRIDYVYFIRSELMGGEADCVSETGASLLSLLGNVNALARLKETYAATVVYIREGYGRP